MTGAGLYSNSDSELDNCQGGSVYSLGGSLPDVSLMTVCSHLTQQTSPPSQHAPAPPYNLRQTKAPQIPHNSQTPSLLEGATEELVNFGGHLRMKISLQGSDPFFDDHFYTYVSIYFYFTVEVAMFNST